MPPRPSGVNPLSSAETPPEAGADVEAPPSDERREAMVATLRDHLGDAVLDTHIRPGDELWVRVRADAWVRAGEVVRDVLGCTFFDFLSAIDWMPSPYGRGEDDPTEPPPERSTEIVQGYAGGETRFQVFARVLDVRTQLAVVLKADVADDDPRIGSWSRIYGGADWHERETWEMFGITFVGHPHLVHIYLPGEFEGHPLRKDFPLLARLVKPWPGIVDVEPMPGAPEGEGDEAETPA